MMSASREVRQNLTLVVLKMLVEKDGQFAMGIDQCVLSRDRTASRTRTAPA